MTVKRRRSRGARAAAPAAALLALLGAARAARAHPELSALGTNRYVTAAVFDGRVDVTDALLEGTLASGDERRLLDADGDGRISDAELAAAERRLRAEGPTLAVEVDGRALVTPATVTIDLGDEPGATAAPVVIERRMSVVGGFPAGARRLRVAITREPPRLLDTEIGVVLGPGLTLATGADRVTFRGPRSSALEERAATFELVGPPMMSPPKTGRPVLGVVLALLALLALGAVGVAALKRTRRST